MMMQRGLYADETATLTDALVEDIGVPGPEFDHPKVHKALQVAFRAGASYLPHPTYLTLRRAVGTMNFLRLSGRREEYQMIVAGVEDPQRRGQLLKDFVETEYRYQRATVEMVRKAAVAHAVLALIYAAGAAATAIAAWFYVGNLALSLLLGCAFVPCAENANEQYRKARGSAALLRAGRKFIDAYENPSGGEGEQDAKR